MAHAVVWVGALRGLEAGGAGFGGLLHSDGVGPVGAGLVEDGLVEGDGVAGYGEVCASAGWLVWVCSTGITVGDAWVGGVYCVQKWNKCAIRTWHSSCGCVTEEKGYAYDKLASCSKTLCRPKFSRENSVAFGSGLVVAAKLNRFEAKASLMFNAVPSACIVSLRLIPLPLWGRKP